MIRLVISQRSAKSELERCVKGLALSLNIQALKRPEEWVRWSGLFLSIQLYMWVGWWAGLLAFLLTIIGSIALGRRRLTPGAPTRSLWTLLEESSPGIVRRELRQGKFDAKVGAECRAILEEAARSANAIVSHSFTARIVHGGGKEAELKFEPLMKATEGLMKSALARIQYATLDGRTPDEDTVTELTKIEANLRVVLAEAKRLAPPSELAADHMEAIQARRELDDVL
jgi:hypothetical protein